MVPCRARSRRGNGAGADVQAEELRGHVRELVRLVQDDRVGTRQEFPEPLLLERHVGQ